MASQRQSDQRTSSGSAFTGRSRPEDVEIVELITDRDKPRFTREVND